MAFWNKLIGSGAKEAGEGIKAAGEGVGTALGSVGGVFTSIRTAITGVDPVVKAQVEKILAESESKLAEQLQTIMGSLNLADAQSGSWFNSGWRPAIGWVCVMAMGLYYPTRIITGMSIWVIQSIQAMQAFIPTAAMPWVVLPPMPEVGISDIFGLVGTLLGSSWFRTIEKNKGTA
jgi:phage-related protein